MSGNYTTMIRKVLTGVLTLASAVVLISSCGKKDANSPGIEYMPDMYRSPSLEVYNQNWLSSDSVGIQTVGMRLPVPGTIPRGFMPYPYPNTTEGYEAAGRELKNPVPLTPEILEQGADLYSKFCIHCHGGGGGGDGPVAAKLPGPPPAYYGALKNLPEGKIFHSITYGKNMMGSHASQLSQHERWVLVHYIQKLQHSKDAQEPGASAVDSTKKVVASAAGVKGKK